MLTIGKNSYLAPGVINSSLEMLKYGYCAHNILIGNHTSIAAGVDFCLGGNHDYTKISTGRIDCIGYSATSYKKSGIQKGLIVIGNDVWIGHNVTIVANVIINSGAVVAANSHVVNDVPPYAIVGGNPAKIIKYRFTDDIIHKFMSIRWWYWEQSKLIKNKSYFLKDDVNSFCLHFFNDIKDVIAQKHDKIFLYFVDFCDVFPLWKDVINQFINFYNKNNDCYLYLIIEKDNITRLPFIKKYISNLSSSIKIVDNYVNEESLFENAYAFFANRDFKTVSRIELCYLNSVKILSAVDDGCFFHTDPMLVSISDILGNCTQFDDYCDLLSLNKDYIIIFVVTKDTHTNPSRTIDFKFKKLFNIRTDVNNAFRCSFICIIDAGEVVRELFSINEAIQTSYSHNNIKFCLSSSGYYVDRGLNDVSISVNGDEYCINKRGLNFLIYDKYRDIIIDSVCFDFFDGGKVYRSKEC